MSTPNTDGDLGKAIGQLIKRAAMDAPFRTRLIAERSAVATDIGIALAPAEKELVDTYPEPLLTAMIDGMVVSSNERRRFLKAGSMLAAATISAGMVGNASAAEGDKKPKSDDDKAKDADALLAQLTQIETQLEAVRKALQKESAEAADILARRRSEQEEVPNSMPMIVAGVAPRPVYRQRTKTAAEKTRDQKALKRVEALEKLLREIESEAESALIEVNEKKKALKAK